MTAISSDPAPGPGGRVARAAGQLGATDVLLNLVIEFGWFGAADWTPGQATAITLTVALAVTCLHNAVNWCRGKRHGRPDRLRTST